MSYYGAIVFWIVVAAVMAIVEGVTMGLVSVWFIIGAAAALIAAFFAVPFPLQVLIFVVVSLISLLLIRPLTKKYISSKAESTNSDRIIGQEALVVKDITELEPGQVKVLGQIWTAKSKSGEPLCEGEVVEVAAIEGVKAVVQKTALSNSIS